MLLCLTCRRPTGATAHIQRLPVSSSRAKLTWTALRKLLRSVRKETPTGIAQDQHETQDSRLTRSCL